MLAEPADAAAGRASPAGAARVAARRVWTPRRSRFAIRPFASASGSRHARSRRSGRTLDALGFTEIQTPKIVATATEGGANLFRVDYFGRDAFLAQSPQFYKQTMVGVFERVYEVGPVFRAEPHETARHLAEYVSLDAELGFIRDHRDVIDVVRAVVLAMIEAVGQTTARRSAGRPVRGRAHRRRARPLAGGRAPHLRRARRARLRRGLPDLEAAVLHAPRSERPEWSRGFDLLYRGLEIVTGGQRLHLYEDYVAALAARGLDAAPFASYLDAFRYGMPPHGGFALGLERFVAQAVGASNVRETTLFPRDRNRLVP